MESAIEQQEQQVEVQDATNGYLVETQIIQFSGIAGGGHPRFDTCEWREYKRDQRFNTVTMGNFDFQRWIEMHPAPYGAVASCTFNVSGLGYRRFEGYFGMGLQMDNKTAKGSFRCQIVTDRSTEYDMYIDGQADEAPKYFNIIKPDGINYIQLNVYSVGRDGAATNQNDHAIWANNNLYVNYTEKDLADYNEAQKNRNKEVKNF